MAMFKKAGVQDTTAKRLEASSFSYLTVSASVLT
jgi:hypothetical protein